MKESIFFEKLAEIIFESLDEARGRSRPGNKQRKAARFKQAQRDVNQGNARRVAKGIIRPGRGGSPTFRTDTSNQSVLNAPLPDRDPGYQGQAAVTSKPNPSYKPQPSGPRPSYQAQTAVKGDAFTAPMNTTGSRAERISQMKKLFGGRGDKSDTNPPSTQQTSDRGSSQDKVSLARRLGTAYGNARSAFQRFRQGRRDKAQQPGGPSKFQRLAQALKNARSEFAMGVRAVGPGPVGDKAFSKGRGRLYQKPPIGWAEEARRRQGGEPTQATQATQATQSETPSRVSTASTSGKPFPARRPRISGVNPTALMRDADARLNRPKGDAFTAPMNTTGSRAERISQMKNLFRGRK